MKFPNAYAVLSIAELRKMLELAEQQSVAVHGHVTDIGTVVVDFKVSLDPADNHQLGEPVVHGVRIASLVYGRN